MTQQSQPEFESPDVDPDTRDEDVANQHEDQPENQQEKRAEAEAGDRHESPQLDASDLNHSQIEAELGQAREQVLRTQAELDNFRKRARRELEDERRYAAMPLLRDLVEVVDNLQRAIDAAAKDQSESGQGMLDGVKMVASHLKNVLGQHHCQEIEAIGQPFDPNLHEAVNQAPSEQYEAGYVMDVALPGYKLHDRVVRPAHVLVSTGPPNATAAD